MATVASLLDNRLAAPILQLADSRHIHRHCRPAAVLHLTDIYLLLFISAIAIYHVVSNYATNVIEDAKAQDEANAAKKARSKKIEQTTSDEIKREPEDFLAEAR